MSTKHYEIDKTYGTNLRKLRGKMTQYQLAVKAGVTPAAISLIECFRRDGNIRTARLLAKALGIKLSQLLEEQQAAGDQRD